MSERLVEVKQNRETLELLVKAKVLDESILKDFDWLIEQAEKAEQLETEQDTYEEIEEGTKSWIETLLLSKK